MARILLHGRADRDAAATEIRDENPRCKKRIFTMEALKSEVSPARADRFAGVRPAYLEALTLVERLHRRLLDVIKDEFDRRGRSDVNAVQALLLYNIADKGLTAGELRTRGLPWFNRHGRANRRFQLRGVLKA
jgi:hypothetical protein